MGRTNVVSERSYDVIISCVDRPWPRTVLNMLANADLIPVDGGLHIDAFPDGGMRDATWRSHVIRPGRPCLSCNKQLELVEVSADQEGLLDDPEYIRGARLRVPQRQNVATLAISHVGYQCYSGFAQPVCGLVVSPGGVGEPGLLQYVLSTHSLSHLDVATAPDRYFEKSVSEGDRRLDLTAQLRRAVDQRRRRPELQRRPRARIASRIDNVCETARRRPEQGL